MSGGAILGWQAAAANARARTPQPAGTQDKKDCACPARKVEGIVLKYQRAHAMGQTWTNWRPGVGHSWYDIQGERSVGWYPRPGNYGASFVYWPGAVNAGEGTRDPHHNDTLVHNKYDLHTRDGDCRTDEEVRKCVENHFYEKEKRGDGYNIVGGRYCHVVAREAAAACKVTLKEQK